MKENYDDLDIRNPKFWENYKKWQKNLANKELDDTDYRDIEEEKNNYVTDSWGV